VLRPDAGEPLRLALDDLLIETVAPDGYQVEQDGGWAVALRTAVDQELREEGLVRELVHAVQLSRKNADLRIEDTIDVALTLPAGLRALAERHAAYIRSETLASALSLDGGERKHTETARVEGEEVVISITATGTIFTETYG
jgi:isoleucyl-tRNA synthetase